MVLLVRSPPRRPKAACAKGLHAGLRRGKPDFLAQCRLSLVRLWARSEAEKTDAIGPLFFWSYIYYLSKYYELLDTVLQLLKGRPPPHFFLHTYHHATVLVMALGLG